MIDAKYSDAIDNFNSRAADALGYGTPGYQPKFHDVLNSQVRSIRTFDPLSTVAPENTYFVVDNGDGSQSYTRGGDFRVSEGRLVSRDGRAVLGYPNGIEKGTLAPITLPQGTPDGAVRIAADGTVSYLGASDMNETKSVIGNDALSSGLLASGSPMRASSLPPTTDVKNSENLAPPTNAGLKNVEVPDIALASDPDMPVSLPHDAGTLDARTLIAKSSAPRIADIKDTGNDNLDVKASSEDRSARMRNVSAPVDDGPQQLVGVNPVSPAERLQDSGAKATPTTIFDSAAASGFNNGLKLGLTPTTGQGTPIGKIALARFATGTVVSEDGRATSGAPIEMGPPGNGQIGQLKVGYRDIGSVNHMAALKKLNESEQFLNAVYSMRTALHTSEKTAMDLIK
jgi:hypothetical protein